MGRHSRVMVMIAYCAVALEFQHEKPKTFTENHYEFSYGGTPRTTRREGEASLTPTRYTSAR